jgi:hypothetical protein
LLDETPVKPNVPDDKLKVVVFKRNPTLLLEVPDMDTGPVTFTVLDDVVVRPEPLDDEVPLIVKLLPPVLVIVVVPEPKLTAVPVYGVVPVTVNVPELAVKVLLPAIFTPPRVFKE